MKSNTIKLSNYIQIRSTVTSKELYNLYNKDKNILELTKLPEIKEMILVANPNLYFAIYEKKQNDKKINKTIIKYINRIFFRTTPLGLFSTVSLFDLYEQSIDRKPIKINKTKKFISIDNKWLAGYISTIELDSRVLNFTKLKTSNLIYKRGETYHLYHSSFWSHQGKYISKDINSTKLIDYIIENTKNTINYNDLIDKIYIDYGKKEIGLDTIKSYINKLIKNEFFVTNFREIMLSEDSFNSLIVFLNAVDNFNTIDLQKIQRDITEYSSMPLGKGIEKLLQIIKKMRTIFCSDSYLKVDFKGEETISFPKKFISDLKDFSYILYKLSNINFTIPVEIKNYTERYIEKYGLDRAVPILELFDEGTGLGLPYHKTKRYKDKIIDKNIKCLLNQKVYNALLTNTDILLNDNDFENILNENREIKPWECEFNIKILDENNLLILPYTGSNMIGKTIGRFRYMFPEHNNQLMKSEKSKVSIEEYFNDAKYLNLSKVVHGGNKLYIPDCINEKRGLTLNDISVFVESTNNGYSLSFLNNKTNDTIQFSQNNNLNINNNNVFNFLSKFLLDISDSYFNNKISIYDLMSTFDNIPHLPRVRYKSITVFPERWNLNQATLENSDEKSILNWLKKWKAPDKFIILDNDTHLFLDLTQYLNKEIFIDYVKKNFNVGITLVSSNDYLTPNIVEKEYILSFKNDVDYETTPIENINTIIKDENRCFILGDEWISLKLYGIHHNYKQFINRHIKSLSEQLTYIKGIGLYFLIYKDTRKHIRVRIKCSDANYFYDVIKEIRCWAKNLINKKIISEIEYDTYKRELERYGEETIEIIEKIFIQDSKKSIEYFSDNLPHCDLDILKHIYEFVTYLGLKNNELYKILNIHYPGYNYKKDYKSIRGNGKNLYSSFKRIESENSINILDISEFKKLNINRTNRIILSILHMHCNRFLLNNSDEYRIMYLFKFLIEDILFFEKHHDILKEES